MAQGPAFSQVINPGRLLQAYRRSLDQLTSNDALRRLWAKDVSLWPYDEHSRANIEANLGWLDLPNYIPQYMARVGELAKAAQRDGIQDIIFIAMGDSNLAMEAALQASSELRWRRVFLLDSIDPDTIRSITNQLDFGKSLFIFANKSGKHIETHALLLYLLDRLKAVSTTDPWRSCIAVTDAGSYLAEHVHTYGFRAALLDPPGIKGRYSSLIHFSLLLS